MMWEVKMRYVVEETFLIEAPTKAEAIEESWGLSDGAYERVRNFASTAKRVKAK